MPQTKERRKQFKIITCELPIETYNIYQEIAKKHHQSFSNFIREALKNYSKID